MTGEPYLARACKAHRLNETAIWPQLEELQRRDLVVLDGERIISAYPFSDRETGHRATSDGCVVNAMCAVDALGIGHDRPRHLDRFALSSSRYANPDHYAAPGAGTD
jgi:hypothetical protein